MANKELQDLHTALAKELRKRIHSSATAADLNVARQFLKDNGIEVADPEADENLNDLTKVLPFAEPVDAPKPTVKAKKAKKRASA